MNTCIYIAPVKQKSSEALSIAYINMLSRVKIHSFASLTDAAELLNAGFFKLNNWFTQSVSVFCVWNKDIDGMYCAAAHSGRWISLAGNRDVGPTEAPWASTQYTVRYRSLAVREI